MSSKKTKSTKESKVVKKSPRKKSYQLELVAPDCWVNELAEIDINDDSWKCSVTIIEEESTHSTVYMEHFNESTISGNRLSVKSISMLEVMHYVVKNIAENISNKSLTPLTLLCKEIFKLVGPDFKNKIPTPLLASLIKYLIHEYKDMNRIIREGMEKRKKEFEEYQQSLWQTPVKSISSKETKSSKLEGKSNKLDKVIKGKTSDKPFTKLRKRGEEWKDTTWIDDSPNGGPQLYIAISTFYDPDLPLELIYLNVPLHAIAKLSLWETRSHVDAVPPELKYRFQSLQDFRHESTPHLSSTIRKRLVYESDKTENSDAKISNFWKIINKLKTEPPTALMFKNVMFLVFTPEHFSFQYHIKSFQEEIYKQISYFLYDVHEITKQHIQYKKEIKQTNVYSADILDLKNMKIYQSLLDSVPHEILNIPFLLDAIVIQVCCLEIEAGQKDTVRELEKTNKKCNITVARNYLTTLLNQLNMKYDLCSDQFENTVFNDKESKIHTEGCNIKHVLKHFDDTNITTFHLKDDIVEFVRKRITHILQVAWNNILLNFFTVPHNDDNIVKLCSEIIKTAKESNENILNYYMYIFIVNSILNSLILHDFSNSSLKTNLLKGNEYYDRENICQDCILDVNNENFSLQSILRNTVSNLSNSSSEISTYKPNDEIVESELFYIEYMTADVMLQFIQAAWSSFNRFETRYCPFTNQVVIVLHNFHTSKVGVFEENWIGKLTTDVPIRDFVEYIIEEEKDWLSQFQPKSTVESPTQDKTVKFCIENPLPSELPFLLPEQQFISHRSLKYSSILKQHKSVNVPSTERIKSPKSKTVSQQSDTSRKLKVKDKYKEIISENKLISEGNPNGDYSFIGYDLGDPMRFQYSGLKKVKTLDGCCMITLETVEKLYGEKFQALTVTMSSHSLFYSYKPYCESTLINPFHLVLSSGIVLYFGLSIKENIVTTNFEKIRKTFNRTSTKQAHLPINNSVLETDFIAHKKVKPIVGEGTEFVGSLDFTPNEWNNSSSFPHTLKRVPYNEIPSIFNLKMSLPNGLHIDFAKDSNLFYIRQTLLSRSMLAKSVEKEKLRCYLSNGCIIKFLSNDTVEVLNPNGTIYTVFENKIEQFRFKKDEPIETSEGTMINSVHSNASVKKNRKVLLKEKAEELNKSLKAMTAQRNDNKPVDSHTPTTNFLNTEKIHSQETVRNLNVNDIFCFECTTSDGKRYSVKNNTVTDILENLLISHTTNVAENCIDSERIDGVSSKHLPDGSLVVQFTDGSRITSTPLEAGEVFCEWSAEELSKWFFNLTETRVVASDSKIEKSLSKTSDGSYIEKSLNSTKIEKALPAKESFPQTFFIQSEMLPNEHERELNMSELEERNIKSELETLTSKKSTGNLLSSMTDQYTSKKGFYHEDGFIVYHISYLMEHPNYSSVYYNANNCEVELKLPLNTHITLKNDGCYEAHFDQASLTVDNDEIYFGKISENGDFERTTIINNSATNNKTPIDLSNYLNRMTSLPVSVDEFCQSIGIKSVRGTTMKKEIESGLLLYCVDSNVNEIIVDYDFNIYELSATKEKYLTHENSFTSLVINDNLSGFRLVSEEEVKRHVKKITKKQGLLQETDNTWRSLLTTEPVVKNESDKWLMNYQKNLKEKTKVCIKTSTYGQKESWTQPFVEKDGKGQDLVEYKAVIVRLLHRIPAKENILDKLKVVVNNFSKNICKNHHLRICLDEAIVDFFSLDELIRNPKLLCKIIKDENMKKNMKDDQFRRNMKQIFLRTLINKSIIKARKIRKQNKEKELKSALIRREIPPYNLSGFGYAHTILNEVFENATSVCKRGSMTSNCEKVNYIIDELLSLVSKTKLASTPEQSYDDTAMNETDSIGITSLVSSIFRSVCALKQDRNSKINLNVIMEKPLKFVTSDDIEFISKIIGSGDSPILLEEEFILEDVLNARLQLSNYFNNLRSMLEFYRGIYTAQN